MRAHLWMIALIGLIVPRRLRADWREEWEAELRAREELLAQWENLNWRTRLDLVRRSAGAFRDALLLQPKRLEDEIFQDLRYGLRMLLKNRGFTAAALLTLALGIGAATAIFSLIDALLLKPLAVKEAQELVLFSILRPGAADVTFSYPLVERFAGANRSFAGVTAFNAGDTLRLTVAGAESDIRPVRAEQVSGNYFALLGVNALAGRALSEDDDRAADPQPVAVISHDFWQRRFQSDPGIVGRKIALNDFPFTIVGVAPPGFSGLEVGGATELWWPLQMTPQVYPGRRWLKSRGAEWLLLMGRLRKGVSAEEARAEMDAIYREHLGEMAAERLSQLTPTERDTYFARRIALEPGGAGWSHLREQFRQPLYILMAAVALVLVVACANVANLLLARASARRKEIAVRLALGAGRSRLIRQLLTESLLLSLSGGALGLLFAYESARLLLAYLPQQRPVAIDLAPDARLLAFTLLVSLLTGVLFGLAPAFGATRLELVTSLKERAGGNRPRRSRLGLNQALIVAQVALSLFLLIGAGLFVRSLQKLKGLDAGFERNNVAVFTVDPGHGSSTAEQVVLYKRLLARLAALPGARAVSVSSRPPLYGAATAYNAVKVPGYTPPAGADISCKMLWVGSKYFETMGMQLLRGRDFSAQEEEPAVRNRGEQAPLPAVINQTMARDFFGHEDPLGRRFDLVGGSMKGIPHQVIGVVRDAKYSNLREQTRRAFYVSYFQNPGGGELTFLLRTGGNPAQYGSAIERAVRAVNPRLQVVGLKTMNDLVDESLARERLMAQLAGFFSLFALLLASIGLYGIMSYAVTRRTSEIGIRLALGARGADIARMVMKETIALLSIGVAAGLGAALAAARLISSLLYGLAPHDAGTIAAATLLLTAVAALAAYLPARRAARVDPVRALRGE